MHVLAASTSTSWIDLSALWKICVVGLLAGAGLPALFALGLRLVSMPAGRAANEPAGGSASGPAVGDRLLGGNPLTMAAAALCFLGFLAGIAWGIYSVVNG